MATLKLTIVTPEALVFEDDVSSVHAHEIDEKAVEEAVQRARTALAANDFSREEIEVTEAALARALAQLHVKRRHPGR